MSENADNATKKDKIFDSRYQIYEIVGRGASSVVYRAKHVLSESKEIALKVLQPKNGKEYNSDLLRHESLALITARHKYVIRLEDFRSVDSICYLALEYAPESNLRDYITKKGGKLIPAQAERYLTQMTEALAFIHNIGMLHRDIKPENILILNDRQARLSDFGVSTLPGQSTSLEELKKGVGTLDYMAPEVFLGEECGTAADVYSLALAFYETLSGDHPFKSLPIAQAIEAREKNKITPLKEIVADIPIHLSDAIEKSLAFKKADRFQNAIELLDFLNNKESLAIEIPKEEPVEKEPEVEEVKEEYPKEEVQEGEIQEEEIEVSADFNDFQYQQDIIYQQTPIWQKVLFVALFIAALFLLFNLAKRFFNKVPEIGNIPQQSNSVQSQISGSSFPFIAQGVYSGNISGFGTSNIPMTMISMEKQKKLIVLLGLPGWQPIPVNLATEDIRTLQQKKITVKSNGIILDLTEVTSNALTIEGSYVNNTTKTKGTWEVSKN